MSDQRRMLSSVRPMAASVSSFHSPTSAQVMRPSGRTAVASIVSSAAPESASWPRWIRCQSPAVPSLAESLTERIRKHATMMSRDLRVVRAGLGDSAGIFGAADRVWRQE